MKQKILFALSLLLGLLFVNAGLNKFFNYMPIPDDLPQSMIELMTALMQVSWLLPLVAIIEIIGGVLFMIPRYRALGAIVLIPILTGITLINLTAAPSGLPLVIALLAIECWVIFENRNKYLVMVK